MFKIKYTKMFLLYSPLHSYNEIKLMVFRNSKLPYNEVTYKT